MYYFFVSLFFSSSLKKVVYNMQGTYIFYTYAILYFVYLSLYNDTPTFHTKPYKHNIISNKNDFPRIFTLNWIENKRNSRAKELEKYEIFSLWPFV